MEKLYRKKPNGRYEEVEQTLSLNQEIMFSCALRYAMGRRTYVVGSAIDECYRLSPLLGDNFKERVVREIREQEGDLGDSFDEESWMKLADFWTPENRYSLEANKYNTNEWVSIDEAYLSKGKYYSIDDHREYHTIRNPQNKNKSYNY